MTSRRKEKFADLYLEGKAVANDIDDFVDIWHKGGTGIPLHKFLGLSRSQYAQWVENPESLQTALGPQESNGSRPGNPRRYSASTTRTKKAATAVSRMTVARKETAGLTAAGNLLRFASDPARLQIILTLSDGEMNSGALSESLGGSQTSISHHLGLLRQGGLISARRQGNRKV